MWAERSLKDLVTSVRFSFFSSVFQLSFNGSMVFCCTTVFVLRTNRTDGHCSLI